MARTLIRQAVEGGFVAQAVRCDSTVVEADIRFPTDAGLAASAVKVLAAAGRRMSRALPQLTTQVMDRVEEAERTMLELGRIGSIR